MRTASINIRTVNNANRFDGNYHLSEGVMIRKAISASPYPLICVGKAANRIFIGNRVKRVYVKSDEAGIPFMSSSDILYVDVNKVKRVSKKYTVSLEEMKLDVDWILISRSGTIGNCAYTNKQHAQKLASEHVIRLTPNDILRKGYIYAYLASRYGHSLLTQGTFGAVIQHIEPDFVGSIPIPVMPDDFQTHVDSRIHQASKLREEAADLIAGAERKLKDATGLEDLTVEDYDYFGPRNDSRQVSAHTVNIREVGTVSFNAFCHSRRINQLRNRIPNSVRIKDVLVGGDTFSTGSFPRVEVKEGNGVMLINQSDIFDTIVKGKWISKRKVNLSNNLVSYGEVLVAGVGTLGENETFCRALFANEDLVGQLISGEFIRMKCNEKMPSGYLFTWLNSDYGFRLIRSTHSGTKLCRPIPTLFLQIPVPVLSKEKMNEIDLMVRMAFTKRHQANNLEKEAIQMVENEIDKWNKN